MVGRHAHNVAFEKSDLLFICMLRPLSTQIKVDDLEVQAAKVYIIQYNYYKKSIKNTFTIFHGCHAKNYISNMQWMPLVEFVEQPLIQGDNMFKKIIDICILKMGKRYCGLSSHQVISKFDGKSSSLYYNILENQDSNCGVIWNLSKAPLTITVVRMQFLWTYVSLAEWTSCISILRWKCSYPFCIL